LFHGFPEGFREFADRTIKEKGDECIHNTRKLALVAVIGNEFIAQLFDEYLLVFGASGGWDKGRLPFHQSELVERDQVIPGNSSCLDQGANALHFVHVGRLNRRSERFWLSHGGPPLRATLSITENGKRL